MREAMNLFFKGVGMGAANVIPGVSGGTIALITGVLEKLLNSLKSIDLTAIRLFFTGKWKEFANHINLGFLLALFSGVFISIVSLAHLLEHLFKQYPIHVWAFFFGLILASVYFVILTIRKWNLWVVILFLGGATFAVLITLLKPASENASFIYLVICGVVAICSMILPGISGSFVLLLMGNYELVMLQAVSEFNLTILLPVILGAVAGLIAFSHFLSWLFRRFPDQTTGSLTGFMLGSLLLLWPWKEKIYRLMESGEVLLTSGGEPVTEKYQFRIPDIQEPGFWTALICIVAGIAVIILIELTARSKHHDA